MNERDVLVEAQFTGGGLDDPLTQRVVEFRTPGLVDVARRVEANRRLAAGFEQKEPQRAVRGSAGGGVLNLLRDAERERGAGQRGGARSDQLGVQVECPQVGSRAEHRGDAGCDTRPVGRTRAQGGHRRLERGVLGSFVGGGVRRPSAGVGGQQVEVRLVGGGGAGVAHQLADVRLAVHAAPGQVGRARPDRGGGACAAQHEELVVRDRRASRLARNDHPGGEVGGGDRGLVGHARAVRDVLEVDHQAHLDAPVGGADQFVEHGGVVELVERAVQRVAGGGGSNEVQQHVVQIAAEPVERLLPQLGGRLGVGRQPVEPALVGLARGHAAVEDHVIGAAMQRLRVHRDGDRLVASRLGRRPTHRVKAVGVGGVATQREVVPHQRLNRVGVRRHLISRLGVGHQRREHLEPAHPDERSALGGAFDAEPQQALAGEFGGGQGERHGVHTAHRVGPNATNRT